MLTVLPRKFLNHFRYRSKFYFFLLTLALGIRIFLPRTDFQPQISPEGYGRDLYLSLSIFKKADVAGQWNWSEGPLLPYYYASLFRIAQPSLQNAILGHSLLVLFNGLLVFFLLSRISAPAGAFAGAGSYWLIQNTAFGEQLAPGYTAAGNVFCFLLFLNFFIKKDSAPRPLSLVGTYLAIFATLSANLTLGLTLLGISFLREMFPVLKKSCPYRGFRFWVLIFLSLLTVVSAGLFYDLPLLKGQWLAFTLNPNDIQDRLSFLTALFPVGLDKIRHAPYHILGGHYLRQVTFLFIIWIMLQVYVIRPDPTRKAARSTLFLSFFLLTIFLFIFVISGAAMLPLAIPLLVLLFFLHLDLATKNFHIVRFALFALFICPLVFLLYRQHTELLTAKRPQNIFSNGRNRIFTLESSDWRQTVADTTRYINQNLKDSDTLFVYPPNPLVYFLTDKDSVMTTDNIPDPQKGQEIISGLRQHAVDYVVLLTCPHILSQDENTLSSLSRYLLYNYQEVAFFKDAAYVGNSQKGCSSKIFKRVSPSPGAESNGPKTKWVRDEIFKQYDLREHP